MMLAYLADVFDHLSDMNLSLQGRDVTVRDVKETLGARIGVWQARIKVGSTICCCCCYPTPSEGWGHGGRP